MLRTRLWMGTLLILLTLGVLLLDGNLHPWYPFLFALVLTLSVLSTVELLSLLGPRRPWPILTLAAVVALIVVSWLPRLLEGTDCPLSPDPLHWVLGTYVAVVLAGFLAAMASHQGEGSDTLTRLAFLLLTAAYLGVLPGFLAQLRWLEGSDNRAEVALALAIFTPKCCDIGAYFTGRLLGRHKMSPVLSPKKTLEGLAGGLVLSTAVAFAVNRAWPVLPWGDIGAIGFGLTVGGAGVLGDLAESLIKRECKHKDASQVMPGFGGVLDVIDSIVYTAPLSYVWLM